jgi:hypothetical protein
MKTYLNFSRNLIATTKSHVVDFKASPISLASAAVPVTFSDSRDGHQNWSLYGDSGSQPVQSVGAFPERNTSFYGNEGTPPNKAGTSEYMFSEWVEVFSGAGTITLIDKPAVKVAGDIIAMLSEISLWSGKLKDQDVPASAQYYITLTIRRQHLANAQFSLVVLPVMRSTSTGDVGYHKLRVYNDSTNTLLQEQDLALSSDPDSNLKAILNISDLVAIQDFVRVEVIAQFALINSNSPITPVSGGSICGVGFIDIVP